MVNEAEEWNDQNYHSVIDTEVVKVPSHARHGFGVVARKRYEGVVEEHAPWTARGRLGSGCS